MTYIEDLENARRYISALVNNDRDAMDASIEPYAGEGRNRDGLIRALARMVLLQAGPKADLEQYLDHLVKSLAALSHR